MNTQDNRTRIHALVATASRNENSALGSMSIDDATDAIMKLLDQETTKARKDENQTYLDRINNFKPKPGQLTTASFGSAGAGMETAGWKRTFEKRISELSATLGDK